MRPFSNRSYVTRSIKATIKFAIPDKPFDFNGPINRERVRKSDARSCSVPVWFLPEARIVKRRSPKIMCLGITTFAHYSQMMVTSRLKNTMFAWKAVSR